MKLVEEILAQIFTEATAELSPGAGSEQNFICAMEHRTKFAN